MAASLARIDEKLSEKRRALADLVESQETLYGEIDAIGEKMDATEASDERDALIDQEKVKSVESNKLTSQIRKMQSEVSDLEAQRAQRVEFNLREAGANRQTLPENPTVAPTGSGRIEVAPPSADQLDHDISSWFRNSYWAKVHGTSLAVVCSGGVGDEFKNDRLHANVTKANNPAVIPPNYTPRLIELLRARSVVRSMAGVRQIPLPNGNLRIPRQSAGSSAAYIGEMTNIAKSDVAAVPLNLAAKKLTALVVASGELLRHANPSVDAMIRDDIVTAMALKEDETFLRAAGSATIPKGLKAYADTLPSTHVIASNQTVNLANVTVDIGKLMLALANSNVPMLNPHFIMSPRTARFLMDLRDGNGNFAFPEMARGELRGFPYRTTTQIPNNLTVSGTVNTSELYFVDASELIIADTSTFMLQVSTEAAYHDGTNVQAAFSLDAAVFRLIAEHDTQMKHDESVAYLNRIIWGL